MIDLDSLWVELAYCETREAKNVTAALRNNVLFRHGIPDIVHSHHAREFVGRAAAKLACDFGYAQTTKVVTARRETRLSSAFGLT